MNQTVNTLHPQRRWLGFELSVLRRLKFNSIAIPFAGRPDLEWHLKFWGKQINNNDICQWSWWISRAMVENLGEVLSPDDVALILKDAYVPSRRMHNPMLKEMMGEMDACWFDNVWLNIQELESRYRRALAYMHVLDVGNYVFSFTPETKHMRRPLSEVLMRLWRAQRAVVNNGQIHYAANQEANEFIRQVRADLMFVRLPRPEGLAALQHGIVGWRETWVRGTGAAWAELIAERRERLGDTVTSKAHYLELVKEFLERARHVPKWAIAHFEDGFLSVAEIGSLVRQMRRRVEATYAKDFSDVLGGARAFIIVVG